MTLTVLTVDFMQDPQAMNGPGGSSFGLNSLLTQSSLLLALLGSLLIFHF
jgi:hypothetical protein